MTSAGLVVGGAALVIGTVVTGGAVLIPGAIIGSALLAGGVSTGFKTFSDPNCSTMEFVKVLLIHQSS